MCTYWLVDKVGGLPKKEVELSIPGNVFYNNYDPPTVQFRQTSRSE